MPWLGRTISFDEPVPTEDHRNGNWRMQLRRDSQKTVVHAYSIRQCCIMESVHRTSEPESHRRAVSSLCPSSTSPISTSLIVSYLHAFLSGAFSASFKIVAAIQTQPDGCCHAPINATGSPSIPQVGATDKSLQCMQSGGSGGSMSSKQNQHRKGLCQLRLAKIFGSVSNNEQNGTTSQVPSDRFTVQASQV